MSSRGEKKIDVVIIGAGGHGLVVLDILRAAVAMGGDYRAVGFIDADPSMVHSTIAGLPMLGHLNALASIRQQGVHHAIVAIGDNRIRRSYAAKLIAAGFSLINAIHPSAVVSTTAQLGKNIVIAPGAIICTGVSISDSALINSGAIIDHECRIGEAAHIAPGAKLAGKVSIGMGAFIGLGANVIQCLRIGDEAVIGSGAVVLHDVEPGTTVAGVPAKLLSRPPVALAI